MATGVTDKNHRHGGGRGLVRLGKSNVARLSRKKGGGGSEGVRDHLALEHFHVWRFGWSESGTRIGRSVIGYFGHDGEIGNGSLTLLDIGIRG